MCWFVIDFVDYKWKFSRSQLELRARKYALSPLWIINVLNETVCWLFWGQRDYRLEMVYVSCTEWGIMFIVVMIEKRVD